MWGLKGVESEGFLLFSSRRLLTNSSHHPFNLFLIFRKTSSIGIQLYFLTISSVVIPWKSTFDSLMLPIPSLSILLSASMKAMSSCSLIDIHSSTVIIFLFILLSIASAPILHLSSSNRRCRVYPQSRESRV